MKVLHCLLFGLVINTVAWFTFTCAAQTKIKPPIFSVRGGIFEDAFSLQLSHESSGSSIYYTLDYSNPTQENGLLYTSPLTINETTVVRAVAFINDATPSSAISTCSYIFPADVIQQNRDRLMTKGWPSYWGGHTVDFGMDPNIVKGQEQSLIKALHAAPSISLVLPFESLFDEEHGIFANSDQKGRDWERPVSIEMFYPPDYFRTMSQRHLNGDPEGFSVNAGLRIRGGWGSRRPTNPKHSFRLYFRGSYGPKNLKYDLFGDEGVGEYDKIDLRTAQSNSWSLQGSPHHTFVRDVFSRDTQRDMGLPYTRSRFYHLYLNGQYWGVYQTQERADQWHGQFYIGGDRDDFDVVKHDNGRIEFSEGNQKAWKLLYDQVNQLASLANQDERDALYMKLQGLNPDGSRNNEFPVLLNADNLIQYMLIIFWTANTDTPVIVGDHVTNNWIGLRNRKDDQGFTFFIHDAEFTLFPGPGSEQKPHDRTGPFSVGAEFEYSNPQWIHQQLMGSRLYRLRFAELSHQHFFGGGALSDSSVLARWDTRVSEVRPLILAESARWGDFKIDPARTLQDWHWAVTFVRDNFLPIRTPIVIKYLEQAKRWEFGRPGDSLVDSPLYGNVRTSVVNQRANSSNVLFQNYPNPFKSTTVVTFSLKQQYHVDLTIYDLLGREVSQLVDGQLSAGLHKVTIDAKNQANGTYVYVLKIKDHLYTKRMMVIK